QCQLKLAEAAVVYREALRLKPDLARAETSAALCEELLAAAVGNQGELTRESLARLYSAMQTQQRPAAELMPVARLLGRENELLLEYWFARLKDLPLPHETPLKDRLTIREDGRLALDLRRTKVTDLSSLAGAPLAVLDLSGSRELTDLSGLRGLDLIELDLAETSVANLTPLREMRTLKRLSLAYSRVTDLGPLGALQLDHLNLEGTRVFDLSPLRGMALTRINLQNTRVSDLSPLAGMPLTHFEASAIAAIDYSPLAGAPLTYCCIQSSPVRDLSFLRDSPVKELILFDCNEARGFSVLAGLKSLDLLILPPVIRDLPEDEMAAIESLRNHPTLRSIAAPERREGAWSLRTIQPEADFWKQWDRERAATRPLAEAGFRFAFTRLQNGSFRLEVIDEPLRDLSFLEGAPLSELVLMGTAITNLNPLKGLPLTTLDIRRTPVADLTPLRDPTLSANLKFLEVWNIPALDFSPVAACTNLEWFDACGTALADLHVVSGRKLRVALLNGTRITNISVLAGMPLERLMINDTGVTDLTPLLHCPTLRELGIPRGAHDVVALRALPLLGRLSYRSTLGGFSAQTAEEFWAEYDYGGITAEAIPLLASRAAGNPEDTLASLEIAVLHAWFGQAAEHEAHCARLIAAAERPDSAMTTIDRAAKSWILMPSTNTALLDRALKLARKPVAQSRSSDPFLAWYQLTLGLAELRAGHDREAEAALVQAEHLADVLQYPADARLWVKGPARLYRAMAYSRNGRTEEALQLFRQASAEMPALPENADKVLSSSADLHTVIYWLAHREAKALLGVER
ncbi:MAG TPA: hypothetical protein PKH32_06950, partial [Verrucomicrobiota bacterium]|nr:hypothetical protein [Verrucomicrobiota bacterium]